MRTALLLLLAAPLALAQPGPQPSDLLTSDRAPAPGLKWSVTMARHFAPRAAIEIRSRLANASRAAFVWDTGTHVRYPDLVLTNLAEGQGSRRVQLVGDSSRGYYAGSGNAKPKPGEVAHADHFDLRTAFGPLAAGKYSLRVEMPKSRFAIRGLAGFTARTLRSPEVRFVVGDTDLAAARRVAASKGIEWKVTKWKAAGEKDGSKWRIPIESTLTNRGSAPLTFTAYRHGRAGFDPDKPVGAFNRVELWTGRWSSRRVGWCKTGATAYVLAPGKSVRLGHGHLRDGIFRFALNVRFGDGVRTVYSRAFEVHNWATAEGRPRK